MFSFSKVSFNTKTRPSTKALFYSPFKAETLEKWPRNQEPCLVLQQYHHRGPPSFPLPLSTQVTASQLSPSSSHKPSILILADSDQERTKWVGLLNELHRILKKNKLKERFVYVPKEAYDSTLPLIKTTQSAAIIGGGDGWILCLQLK